MEASTRKVLPAVGLSCRGRQRPRVPRGEQRRDPAPSEAPWGMHFGDPFLWRAWRKGACYVLCREPSPHQPSPLNVARSSTEVRGLAVLPR